MLQLCPDNRLHRVHLLQSDLPNQHWNAVEILRPQSHRIDGISGARDELEVKEDLHSPVLPAGQFQVNGQSAGRAEIGGHGCDTIAGKCCGLCFGFRCERVRHCYECDDFFVHSPGEFRYQCLQLFSLGTGKLHCLLPSTQSKF